MRNPQQIISDLKRAIHWSIPNLRFAELLSLANELEHAINTQSSQEEALTTSSPVVEKVVIKEASIVEEVTIEDVIEEFTIEDIAEEVTVEDVTEEITTKKTKSKK